MQDWLEAPNAPAAPARALRVAHLVPNLQVGGRERMTVALCSAQRALGIESVIIGYEPAPPGTSLVACPHPYLQLDCGRTGFARQLRGILRDTGFDLAHAHGHVPAIHLAAALGDQPLLPSAATMHTALRGTWPKAMQVRRALRRLDLVSAVTPAMADSYARLSGRAVTFTPNGIDVSRFAGLAIERPVSGEPFRFAMLSRLDPDKRHLDAIAAADLLRIEGLPIELHIAGEGAMDKALRSRAATRPWLVLAGSVRDPAEFLRGKHALVMPSLAEGMPLALAEALAAGLPGVLSDLPSLRAMAGQAAVYATAGDRTALAAQMRAMASSEIVHHRAARAARARAQSFTLDAVAAGWAEHYRALYARANASLL